MNWRKLEWAKTAAIIAYAVYGVIVIALAALTRDPRTLLYLCPPAVLLLYAWLLVTLMIAAAFGWHGAMP
jgi:hypothetical protein